MTTIFNSSGVRTPRNYAEVRARSLQIRELFRRKNIQFNPASDLGVLLKGAEALADKYDAGQLDASDFHILLKAAQLDRIADALLLLEGELNCESYLQKLTSKSLNFLERSPSYAKDIYWEIELWSMLKKKCASVRLVDPPDIVLDTPDGTFPIACKKIYSSKNVARQLSAAVKQLEPFDGAGIVAVNIDDLVPGDSILRSATYAQMAQFIDAENVRFISSCHQPIQKYFGSGRLSAIAVSTSLLAEVVNEGTRFNNARQMTIWARPNAPAVVASRLDYFANVLGASIESQ